MHQFDFSENSLEAHRAWTVSRWVQPLVDKSSRELADLAVMSLGLAGEIGEVADVVETWSRSGVYDKVHLTKELGDVFYYWARVTAELRVVVPGLAERVSLRPTVRAPDDGTAPVLEVLRLVRAGSTVSELMKKFIRDGHLDLAAATNRLSDVFAAWHELCDAANISAQAVVNANFQKVEGRAHRGTLRGSGNDR